MKQKARSNSAEVVRGRYRTDRGGRLAREVVDVYGV
jgi:hypothetical protein